MRSSLFDDVVLQIQNERERWAEWDQHDSQQRLWHRWQRWWWFSLYVNAVDLRSVLHYFDSHEHFYFSEFALLFIGLFFTSIVFLWWFYTNENNDNDDVETCFPNAHWIWLVVVFFCLCTEFTWDLAPSLSLFRWEKLALQWFFKYSTYKQFEFIYWESFAFIFSDKRQYFLYLADYYK